MAIQTGQMGQGQPSNYFLDNFVAHKISSLTECGAPELPMESSWLNTFILNSALTMTLSAANRPYMFNFIRRAEGAFSAYREARLSLIDYINSPPNVLSPYFRSLLNFEICASQCIEGYELIRIATGVKYFQKGDQSLLEKLYDIYNDSKHMENAIKQGRIPTEATAAVWITNQGLETTKIPSGLSFAELAEILTSMGEVAEKLSRPAA
jgi:hypothetical protein